MPTWKRHPFALKSLLVNTRCVWNDSDNSVVCEREVLCAVIQRFQRRPWVILDHFSIRVFHLVQIGPKIILQYT